MHGALLAENRGRERGGRGQRNCVSVSMEQNLALGPCWCVKTPCVVSCFVRAAVYSSGRSVCVAEGTGTHHGLLSCQGFWHRACLAATGV